MTSLLLAVTIASLGTAPPATSFKAGHRPIDFSREVRPILSNYCFLCHGPDDKARKARLRLDVSSGAMARLASGTRAIVAGKPHESELISRLTTGEEADVMPPRETGKRLKPQEIETLRRWIAQGAAYAKHWSYVAPVRPPVPRVSDPSWVINPIDSFILARLDREGLRPSPAADRYTLIRRVSLDLTGLPPTPEEADRFVNDPRPDSYERAVDGILAKPSYGERWAAVWLDLARYGDSVGYIHDPPRTIWRWRDWLVVSLNQNIPYDRFTIEMLAGDLLPNPTSEQLIATGFHRNTTNNTEGGSNAEEYRFASVVDRVNTTMQVWMGTTMACAQCHNHKYDPFSQKEYYQIFAIFNNTADSNSEDPVLAVPRVGRTAEYAVLADRLARAKARLAEETQRLDAARPVWEKAADRAKLPAKIAEILALSATKRSGQQVEALTAYYRSQSTAWSAYQNEVNRLQGERDQVGTTTLVMKEAAVRPSYIAIRGDFQNRGDSVGPGVPASLHPRQPAASSTAWPWPGGSFMAITRSPHGWLSIASGRRYSGSESSKPPRSLACKETRPAIPNCSTGWPRNTSGRAGIPRNS